MAKHHLVLGELVDYLTGRTVVDTDDERDRQNLAKLFVRDKGFSKIDIEPDVALEVSIDDDSDTARIDFVVRLKGRAMLILKYGPGSIVSRQRPAVAAARLLESYIVPYTVVSNGQDAVVMDTHSGKVVGKGLDAIPAKAQLESEMDTMQFQELAQNRTEKEERILFCMEVLSNRDCECNTDGSMTESGEKDNTG